MASREPIPVMDHPDPGEQAMGAVSRESGVMALANLNDADFEARLEALKRGQERIRRIQRELMVEGEDYGVIPGTKKHSLLKPGAEKLCHVYGLVPTYAIETTLGDGLTTPTIRVQMTSFMHRGDTNGPVVGVGVGAANSWERKHRYRGAERTCPSCGCEGTIKRSSFERDGDRGWYCHAKVGGCGDNFLSTDPAITEQQRGQVDNDDPFDLENTILKMARKRTYIDGTLTATATSGLFTQDLEDMGGAAGGEDHGAAGPAPAGNGPQSTASSASPARGAHPQPPREAQPPKQSARGPAPAQSAGNNGGKLPRWTGPCPRCSRDRTVLVSKLRPGFYACWKGGNPAGCGYEFTPEDAQLHEAAAAQRTAAPSGDDFQVTDDDVPY